MVSRARRFRGNGSPTICPHCLINQGSPLALSSHIHFGCPSLRGRRWEILRGPGEPDATLHCEWRARSGSRICNLRMPAGIEPTDADFDAAMHAAVIELSSRRAGR